MNVVWKEKIQLSAKDEKTLNQLYVSIMHKEWIKLEMPKICCYIEEWKADQLILGANRHENILKDLSKIFFSQLRILSLFQNNIESIQCLSLMDFPLLSGWVSLSNIKVIKGSNHIVKLQDLKKCAWPKVQGINICDNHVVDAEVLTKANNQMDFLTIQHNGDPIVFTNIAWIAKLQTKKLTTLWLKNSSRMQRSRMRAVWKRKYEQIKLQIE